VKKLIPVALALLLVGVPAAHAQEKPDPPPAPQAQTPAPQVPLRVQVVVTKLLGEKTLSSIPYSLSVVSNAGRTSMRMGVDVPVAASPTTYNYRSVGTNIDCTADAMATGSFRLTLAVTDTAVLPSSPAAQAEREASPAAHAASFRNFTANFYLLLRDGQTAQHTAATDPVSGETVRIDVTLNVLK
jgi:hypothetical protein